MNIYTKKRSWKALLLVFASIIVVVSLWYTNGFIQKLSIAEKNQVELWAKAIDKKAELVKYTENLFENLRLKEQRYASLWAEATKKLIAAGPDDEVVFFTEVIQGNTDIPVIVTNEAGGVIHKKNLDPIHDKITVINPGKNNSFTNLDPIKAYYLKDQYNNIYYRNSKTYYQLRNTLDDLTKSFVDEIVNNSLSTPVIITDSSKKILIAYGGALDSMAVSDSAHLAASIAKMSANKEPIIIDLANSRKYIFYDESPTLTRMRYFPTVLFSAILLFLIISYLSFSVSRKSEQSKVWAGMAKETAHQLGTPISSLMGWIELMKLNYPDENGFVEMNRDIDRLSLVSERFSKIGSIPELKDNDLLEILESVRSYMQRRAPSRILVSLENNTTIDPIIKLNKHLIVWVFENLIRNAVDAIGTDKGEIIIAISTSEKGVIIDVTDSGKGIPKGQHKTIFNPGISTKSRGWGLGLSLSKRIVEEYHKGKIFVKSSTIGQGSIFRITLRQ